MSDRNFVQTGNDRRLPPFKWLVHVHIAIDPVAERVRPQRDEFRVQVLSEFAEMLVVAVAQCQDRVREVFEAGKVFEAELLIERLNAIRRVPVPIGAGKNQRVLLRGQRRRSVSNQSETAGTCPWVFNSFAILRANPSAVPDCDA